MRSYDYVYILSIEEWLSYHYLSHIDQVVNMSFGSTTQTVCKFVKLNLGSSHFSPPTDFDRQREGYYSAPKLHVEMVELHSRPY